MSRRTKEAVLTLVGIYPLLTVVLVVGMPIVGSLPFLVQNLVYTVVLVALMSFVVMPFLHRVFAGWLQAGPEEPSGSST